MKTAVIVPNWNGAEYLAASIDSLLSQTVETTVVVVDNGSTDSSTEILKSYDEKIVTIHREKNYGFTGGVNPGIEYAIDHDYDAVALFNNDAVADKDWLKNLTDNLKDGIGIATSLILSQDGKTIDTTGDTLTIWGLPYPRSREKPVSEAPKQNEHVFGASGGASLYSVAMLKEIGLFDQDFFAYYEDIDISLRAQLAGWKVLFIPSAIAYHRIGKTSERIKGFTVYQTFKNLPIVMVKDIPKGLRKVVYPRFILAYISFFFSALFRGHGWYALKGFLVFLRLLPKKLRERKQIQSAAKVDVAYINSILTHDLPENSNKLRKLRSIWWRLRGKTA